MNNAFVSMVPNLPVANVPIFMHQSSPNKACANIGIIVGQISANIDRCLNGDDAAVVKRLYELFRCCGYSDGEWNVVEKKRFWQRVDV